MNTTLNSDVHPVDRFVGTKVRIARLSAGLSQNEIAKKLGITFQQVQKYESGKNRISASRLYDISNIVNVSVSYFFDDFSTGEAEAPEQDFDTNLYDQMSSPDAVDLVKAFNQVEDKNVRKSIINLVKSIKSC